MKAGEKEGIVSFVRQHTIVVKLAGNHRRMRRDGHNHRVDQLACINNIVMELVRNHKVPL